jgi:glycosyltransferase involved in cell wall biosynthesis
MAVLTLFKGKIVSHIHCNPEFIKKWNVFSIIYNFGINRFHKVILVSKETLNGTVFKKKLASKMIIINNVVNSKFIINKSKKYETDKYDILFFGRLIDIKQPQIVIEVTRRLKKDFPNIKTCLVGDGILMNRCNELLNEYNLNNNVTLVGFKSNPFPYIKNSKVALMPSKTEGLPMSAIESLVLGVPVLNSGKGGLSTLFKDNKEYICENVDEYCTKIKQILMKKGKFSNDSYQKIASKYTDINGYINEIVSNYE